MKRRRMLATIDGDIVTNIRYTSAKNDTGTEIPPLPRKADLNRLRYDDGRYVDLMDLDEIWIDRIGQLHCKDIGNCQLVEMTYTQRRDLVKNSGGQWKIKSDQEKVEERQAKEYTKLCTKRQNDYPSIGAQLDEILRYLQQKDDLTPGLAKIVGNWQATKAKHPK